MPGLVRDRPGHDGARELASMTVLRGRDRPGHDDRLTTAVPFSRYEGLRRSVSDAPPPPHVMPGLVPGIHVLSGREQGRGWPGQAHGCPVRFLWTRCMALILLCSKRLATFWTGKRIKPCCIRIAYFTGC